MTIRALPTLSPPPIDPMPAITTPGGRPVWYPDTAILTTEEVAAVLNVEPRTVQRWAKRGRLRRTTMAGRFLFRDVVALLDGAAA